MRVEMKYVSKAQAMLTPYIKAGQIKAFDGPTEIVPGIKALVHPGYTPGSAFYERRSRGRSLLFVGGIIHVPSIQFPNPKMTINERVLPSGPETRSWADV